MQSPAPEEFEKLGIFYLGRQYDLEKAAIRDELALYDSRDLTTHALCVGMTGSGKTGLCLSLLEEAAIDGIPAIAIDPKGDLGNLMLAFPDLSPADLKPWLSADEAARKGVTIDELAEKQAQTWREGLAQWGQSPERIARFRDAVDINIYTPGSIAGLPLTVLHGFDAPPESLRSDLDAMREKINAATSSLLSLLGIDADPLMSHEAILLGSILDHAWQAGKNVLLGDLIRQIQTPPFDQVGVLDLESFMSTADRAKLSMQLNNLLASPTFKVWLQGESLNIQNLLYSKTGKPRLSILSIAHLSDRERMFFVTILLGELQAWMRSQKGTSSLRAMFYMDEVFGYFPPVANPPSKAPMLSLLKQARAFGLGIVLATQNPVDLDYKGMSNIGTWMLGRLQTERDKQRVIEGLEGAAIQGGRAFDRQQMERILAGLAKRVFLMNNVHDAAPTVFQTRWALSFLAGPLSRDQIATLTRQRAAMHPGNESDSSPATIHRATLKPSRPVSPAGVTERFVAINDRSIDNTRIMYCPAIRGVGQVHYVKAGAGIDLWHDIDLRIDYRHGLPQDVWASATSMPDEVFHDQPDESIPFAELPSELRSAVNFKNWVKDLKEFLYRQHPLELYFCKELDVYAPPGLSEREARIALGQQAREQRDVELEKLRDKYAKLDDALTKRIQQAKERLDKETAEYDQAKWSSLVDVGGSLLGGLLGSRRSRLSTSKIDTAVRRATRTKQRHSEMASAADALDELQRSTYDLNEQAKSEAHELANRFAPENLQLTQEALAPRKGDLRVDAIELIWVPVLS